MPTALHLSGLSTQAPQGLGVRVARRLGGAVRSALVGGISLAGRLRRAAASRPSRHPAAPRNPELPPQARQPRVRRRPEAAPTVPPPQPARRGWLARWFGVSQPNDACIGVPDFPDDYVPFSPETHPGLSPETCAIFNTPLEECDPEILRCLLAGLAEQIAAVMPPASGMTDAGALFATLWGRIDGVLADATPQAPEALPPDPAPVPPRDPAPDAPPAAAGTPAAAMPAAAPHAATTIARARSSQQTAALPEPGADIRAAPRHGRTTFPHRRRPPGRSHPTLIRCRLRFWCRPRTGPRRLPPRRLCYAACAGPP